MLTILSASYHLRVRIFSIEARNTLTYISPFHFSERKFVSDRTAANMSCGAASAAIKSPALLNEEVSEYV